MMRVKITNIKNKKTIRRVIKIKKKMYNFFKFIYIFIVSPVFSYSSIFINTDRI